MNLVQFEMAKIRQNRTVIGALIASAFILFGIFSWDIITLKKIWQLETIHKMVILQN